MDSAISSTHNRFPNLAIWKRDWEPLGNLTLEPSGIWQQDLHSTGETDSWRAQTKSCATPGPRRKEQWPQKRLTQTCLWVSRLLAEAWIGSVLLQGQGHWVHQDMQGTFRRRATLSSLPPPVWPRSHTGREHSPAHQQKIGLKIYWAWPCPSEQDPLSPTVNFSISKVP